MSVPGAEIVTSFAALLGLSSSQPNASPGSSTVQRTHRAAKSTSSTGGASRRAGSRKVDRSASAPIKAHDFSHLRIGAERRQADAKAARLRGLTPEQQLSDGGLSAERMAAAVAKTGRSSR